MIDSSLLWLNYAFSYFCLKLNAWLYCWMLCNFTCILPLSNHEAWSVINNVAARRKKQNNYFFWTQVLIMIQKSVCILGGSALAMDYGLQGGLPSFPYECKTWRLRLARQVFISLFKRLTFNYNHWDLNQSIPCPNMNINQTPSQGVPLGVWQFKGSVS